MGTEKLVAIVMLVSLTFSAGLQVKRSHLIAVLKDYGLLGRALLANFVLVPIFGVLLVRAFELNTYVATGVLLMAIAPGAPFVLISTRKKGESLGFAVSLAFLMPALSILMVPLTATLVLPASDAARVPALQLAMTLVLFQLVPLLVGILISDRASTLAPKFGRPALLVFWASVVALLVLLAPRLGKDVATVYGSHGMWAILCIVILSIATGWLLGGPDREFRRTLGNATELRNIGLCALVATANFPGTEVATAVLTYFLIQFLFSTFVGIYYTRTAAPPAVAVA